MFDISDIKGSRYQVYSKEKALKKFQISIWIDCTHGCPNTTSLGSSSPLKQCPFGKPDVKTEEQFHKQQKRIYLHRSATYKLPIYTTWNMFLFAL